MATEAQIIERLIRLLIAVGGIIVGVLGTVASSWISNKLHDFEENRKAHLNDLRERVLNPLRKGFEEHFKPLLTFQIPLLSIEHAATEFDFNAPVTEEPTKYGPHLVAKFPSAEVFGPIDSALLHDATANHFSELMAKVDAFYREWMAYSWDCHAWAARLAREILDSSGLPAFPNPDAGGPYVMHYRLAVFLYLRLFRFPAGVLQKQQEDARCYLKGGSFTLASGTAEQTDALLTTLNTFLDSQNDSALRLREKASTLQSRYSGLSGELEYAIANRRLHGRCDLVTFF